MQAEVGVDALAVGEVRGKLRVTGISDAPIPWPQARRSTGGRPFLIVCGDLVKAIRRESEQAVAHHWGVSDQTQDP